MTVPIRNLSYQSVSLDMTHNDEIKSAVEIKKQIAPRIIH